MSMPDYIQDYFAACDAADEESAHKLFGGGPIPPGTIAYVGIEAEPVRTLPEALSLLADEELMLAIELYDFSTEGELQLEGLPREELLLRAAEVLSNPQIHVLNLRSIPAEAREDYLWIAREGAYEEATDDAATDLRRLLELDREADEDAINAIVRRMERASMMESLAGEMLVFPFVHNDLITFVMPDEVREACLSVATDEFLEYVEDVELVVSYVDAATNLYGVITVEDLIDLVAAYEPDSDIAQVSDLVVEVLEVDRLWPHFVENGFIAHELFREGTGLGEALAFDLLSVASNTPRYTPDRDTFLCYAFPEFDEENYEADLLSELIVDVFPDSDSEDAYQIVQFVQQCARQGMRSEIIVESLVQDLLPEPISSSGQASLLIKQVAKLVHTTRTWALNGHAPAEMEQK